jgi:hypothetical protein
VTSASAETTVARPRRARLSRLPTRSLAIERESGAVSG